MQMPNAPQCTHQMTVFTEQSSNCLSRLDNRVHKLPQTVDNFRKLLLQAQNVTCTGTDIALTIITTRSLW